MSTTASTPDANPPAALSAPRRPWYRLHASTWVVAGLAAIVLAVIVASPVSYPLTIVYFGSFECEYDRGWPWAYAKYRADSEWAIAQVQADANWNWQPTIPSDKPHLPAWLDWRLWWLQEPLVSFNPWVLVGDVACAFAVLAAIAAAFEWWRRRRARVWQLHLMDLLSLTLFVAIASAWWTWWDRAAARERQAEERFSDGAAHAFVGPAWLIRLIGPRYCSETFYRLTRITITDDRIWLDDTLVDDLRACRFATKLSIELPSFPDDAWPVIAEMPLVELFIKAKVVPEDALRGLAGMRTLRTLALQGRNFPYATDSELKALASMTSVTSLRLTDYGLPPSGAVYLTKLTNLQELGLDGSTIDDAGLEYLARLKNLQSLDLSSTHVSDAGIRHLQDAPNLANLVLDRSLVSDGCIDALKDIPRLKRVSAKRTAMTAAGTGRLRQARPDIQVDIGIESDIDVE